MHFSGASGPNGKKNSDDNARRRRSSNTNPLASWTDPTGLNLGSTGYDPKNSSASPSDLSSAFSLSTSADSFTHISYSSSHLPTTPNAPPSVIAASTSAFIYTVYQPPPLSTQQQQPQTRAEDASAPSTQIQLLEPEQVPSSGTSTLVGSPMTPRFGSSHSGGAPWHATQSSSQQSARLSPTITPTTKTVRMPSPSIVSSTSMSRFSLFKGQEGTRRLSQVTTSNESPSYPGLCPASVAARSLGYVHRDAKEGQSWEPHVSVMMDSISLDSFADDSHLGDKDNRSNRSGLGIRDGTMTPQSAIGKSSNMSMVTLLGQRNSNSNSRSNSSSQSKYSSSSTFFKGFLPSKFKSSSKFFKLHEPRDEFDLTHQHQTISMTSERKVYSIRPKAKAPVGASGSDNRRGKGDGGNGDRKALFSNERTFMHWIKFGILLGTTALTLCNFGKIDSLAFYIGVSVMVIAMSSLGYAATVFHRRDRSLSRRLRATISRKEAKHGRGAPVAKSVEGSLQKQQKPEKRMDPSIMFPHEVCYYDRVGPTVLCSALLFAYSINFYLSITQGSALNKDGGLSFFHQD